MARRLVHHNDSPILRRLTGTALVLLTVMSGAAVAEDASGASGSGVPITPALDDAIGALQPVAQNLWPDTYAGLWVHETEDGVVHSVSLGFTEDATAKVAQLAEGFPEPELLQPVILARSLHELENRQQRMIADREAARKGTLVLPGVSGARYNLDIDIRRNALVVTVEDSSSVAVATFKGLYGEDVIVEQGDLGGPEACTRADCRYNLRSGLKTVFDGTWCSTAFTVVTSVGNRNILSAAHCGGGDVGNARHHGGERYGTVIDQHKGGRVDAERHSRWDPFAMKAWIYVDTDHKAVGVKERSSWDTLGVGTHACKSGATTGKSCGEITSKHFSPSWVPNSERFVKTDYCAGGGDSGSGVYRKDNWSRAHGIHSGGGSGSCSDASDWSAFGHIQYALGALDVTLVFAP
jgi:streptogrisin C